jgi:acyl-CoA thioesterase I
VAPCKVFNMRIRFEETTRHPGAPGRAAGKGGWLAIALVLLTWSAGSAMAARIACVGDSITWGWALTNRAQQSYPAILQGLVGPQHIVKNFGTNGCTVLKEGDKPYWKAADFTASTEFKPDLVVIMLGSNDARPKTWRHVSDFLTNYVSLVEHYRALGARVYVATPPPVYAKGRYGIPPAVVNGEVVPLVREVAVTANAPLIDIYTALSGKPECFPDNVHPNLEGVKLIAQTVAAALTKGGLVSPSMPEK